MSHVVAATRCEFGSASAIFRLMASSEFSNDANGLSAGPGEAHLDARDAPSAPAKASEPDAGSKPNGDGSAFGQVAAAVIGVAGAGIGGLGFVVAVGAIVTQARFRGAGLPDEQAAAAQTQGVLLDVGGRTLGVAVLVALALVAAVHWSDELFEALGRLVRFEWLKRLGGRIRGWPGFFGLIFAAVLANYLLWADFQLRSGPQRVMLGIITLSALVGAAIATQLARGARSVRGRSRPETLFLLGLFVSATVLAGAGAAAGNLARPQVRAAAVLLTDPPEVVCGLYIGQTSDRVYIGETEARKGNPDLGDHSYGEIIAVARSRVSVLLIGSSESLSAASGRAENFRDQLTATAVGLNMNLTAAGRRISCQAPRLTHAPAKT